MTAAAVLVLTAAAWLLGRALLARLVPRPTSRPYALVLELLAGLLVLHLVLTAHQGVGLAWSRPTVGVALALAGAALVLPPGGVRSRREPAAPVLRVGWGWGDALAVVATAGFAGAALTLRSVHPDFIYHWGVKAKKFLLAGGVDFTYLAHLWNHYTHPDYPNLLPELYAVSSLTGGGFREGALLLWGVLFFAALVLAGREGLHRAGVPPAMRQAGTATLALGAAAFSIGFLQAGGADLMMALAFAAALPPLMAPRPGGKHPEPGAGADDLATGVAAAFAAASKIEGVPLAGFLAGVYLLRRGAGGRRPATLVRVLLPPALVIAPWVVANLRHDLFQPTNLGPFDPGRWPVVFAGIRASLALRAWHGMPYLLLLSPLLLACRRVRPVAAVALLQLGFYLAVYFTTPLDVDFYVRSSFPRLLFHLLPAVFVAALPAFEGWLGEGPRKGGGEAPPPRGLGR